MECNNELKWVSNLKILLKAFLPTEIGLPSNLPFDIKQIWLKN